MKTINYADPQFMEDLLNMFEVKWTKEYEEATEENNLDRVDELMVIIKEFDVWDEVFNKKILQLKQQMEKGDKDGLDRFYKEMNKGFESEFQNLYRFIDKMYKEMS